MGKRIMPTGYIGYYSLYKLAICDRNEQKIGVQCDKIMTHKQTYPSKILSA